MEEAGRDAARRISAENAKAPFGVANLISAPSGSKKKRRCGEGKRGEERLNAPGKRSRCPAPFAFTLRKAEDTYFFFAPRSRSELVPRLCTPTTPTNALVSSHLDTLLCHPTFSPALALAVTLASPHRIVAAG